MDAKPAGPPGPPVLRDLSHGSSLRSSLSLILAKKEQILGSSLGPARISGQNLMMLSVAFPYKVKFIEAKFTGGKIHRFGLCGFGQAHTVI